MTKGIFLDRDGVINEVRTNRVTFVNQPQDFYLLDGVAGAIKTFNELDYSVFVVTNQGGIGLGYMTEAALRAVHQQMQDDLAECGDGIDDIAYCPHKPHADCPCRKPEPKMICDLACKHNIDLSQSYMIGDRKPDIEAGNRAGTSTVLLGEKVKQMAIADMVFPDLRAFADWLNQS